ncbi:MAG: YhjD/YihY/BrkB family envelope integrity protein [Longicatena sp.]
MRERLKYIYQEFTSFEGNLFIYSLSFSMLLALAPSLLLFAMLFRYAYLPMDLIINFVINFMPDVNMELLNQMFKFFNNQDYSIISFVITMVVSFYLASRSIFSFLLISASHEEVEIPKWSIRIKSIVLFVFLTISFVLAIYIATILKDFLPIVVALMMFVLFTVMYRTLSFRKRNWSFGIIGAMFSTICIMGLAALFVTIVTNFTSYKDVYGPLASLVTLLLAIYLISCIIYLGFCLNIVCEDDYGNEAQLPLKNATFFMWCQKIHNRFTKRF